MSVEIVDFLIPRMSRIDHASKICFWIPLLLVVEVIGEVLPCMSVTVTK